MGKKYIDLILDRIYEKRITLFDHILVNYFLSFFAKWNIFIRQPPSKDSCSRLPKWKEAGMNYNN
jgi:hypothetical protein